MAAFLRAVNVGGSKVFRMGDLVDAMSKAGFANVRALLASGNLVFDGGSETRAAEERIRGVLANTFQIDTTVMVRSFSQMASLCAHLEEYPEPDPSQERGHDDRVYVLFVDSLPSPTALQSTLELSGGVDDLRLLGPDLVWHCRRSKGISTLTTARLEKVLERKATARDRNTVRKVLAACLEV